MTREEWLASLKVGDKAIIKGGLRYNYVVEISGFTRTKIVVDGFGEMKFRKSDGNECGKEEFRFCLHPYTKEAELQLERKKYTDVICDTKNIYMLNTETLKQIYEIMTNEDI